MHPSLLGKATKLCHCFGLPAVRAHSMWRGGEGQASAGEAASSPRLLDELGRLLGVSPCEAAQVHGLFHNVEVLVERKGDVWVAVPCKVPAWRPQTGTSSFPWRKQPRSAMRAFPQPRHPEAPHSLAASDFASGSFPRV